LKNRTIVPTINFGVARDDPADAMFTTANFPSASAANLNTARALYAILTGRVISINALSRLNENTNKYEYLGLGTQRARMRELGLYAQDSWRWKPNFTLNYGLRYELQLPFYPRNDSCLTATIADVWGVSGAGNLFAPGVLTGKKPEFIRFGKGVRAFEADKNNFAPSLGLSWVPGRVAGLLGRILGAEGDSVFRTGYALAYNRGGMSDFSGVFGAASGCD
jgi:outer membrane receptor protein involved in Fe transport